MSGDAIAYFMEFQAAVPSMLFSFKTYVAMNMSSKNVSLRFKVASYSKTTFAHMFDMPRFLYMCLCFTGIVPSQIHSADRFESDRLKGGVISNILI